MLRRSDVRRSVSEEMKFHLEMSAKQIEKQEGLSPDEALAEARQRFGNRGRYGDECFDIGERDRQTRARAELINDIRMDLRYALRQLRLKPGFTVAAVLCLSIGIGGITMMYSTLAGVALRPLPYDEADRLVWVQALTTEKRPNSLSALDYFDYREQSSAFESIAAQSVWQPGVVITGDDEPERVPSTTVSHNLFATLRVAPLHGRSFLLEEEVLGGPNVVVLSSGFWQRRYAGDPSVVGSAVTINGASYEVVGVMPESFNYPAGVQLWFPMQRGGPAESGRGNNNFNIVARLADGVSIDQGQAEMDALAAQLSETYPESKGGWGIQLQYLHDMFFSGVKAAMLLLMGAVVLVLLIACANLSSLFLARVTSRQKEFSVRLSLGATRGVVVRQILTESLVVTLVGAAGGVLLAILGIHVLKSFGPGTLPRLQTVGVDTTVLLVTAVVSVFTGLLFGLAPALRGSRAGLVRSMQEVGRSTSGRGSLRLRSVMVIGQVALSLTLLIGSGLLIRSFLKLQEMDTGMNEEGLLTLNVQLPAFNYRDPAQLGQFFDDALERIRSLPGVVAAAGADGFPLYGGPWNGIWPADRPPADPSERIAATRRFVTEDYFRTLETPVLAGRTFESTDRSGGPPVTVVSRTLAEQAFPGENALGEVLILPWGEGIPLEIIGVVGDLPDYGLAAPFRPVFYLPNRMSPRGALRLAIRVDGEPTALVPAVRSSIWEVDRNVPITSITTMAERFSGSSSGFRFSMFLLGTFAAIAIILASVGLYGVLAYFVNQRTREMGIRIAMGAGPIRVMSVVIWRGVIWAGGGLAAGLLGGLGVSTLLRNQLVGIAPTDLVTYVVVSLFLALIAFLACIVPARRALRVDPVVTLRAE
jgi:putative ABC transport system permease protein